MNQGMLRAIFLVAYGPTLMWWNWKKWT
uniref:Uncharacterized protein n=1 Tax=Rhizophora mucronata TaxID=61149 RepID=A0A2P2IXD9_RHIMU